jgi:Mn2+/Fe2+ NRAMP family transporter
MAEAFRLLVPVPFALIVVATPSSSSFYGVIGASIVVGLALNFVGIDPIRALYVSAILNGLAAPPLILLMLILSNSSSTRLEGGWLSDGLVGVALVVMTVSGAVYLIGSIVG